MKEPKYCVRARNRLTGEREIVTPPLSRKKAEEALLKYTNMHGTKKPYTHPKVEIYPPPTVEIGF
jgi:hypothetical protein